MSCSRGSLAGLGPMYKIVPSGPNLSLLGVRSMSRSSEGPWKKTDVPLAEVFGGGMRNPCDDAKQNRRSQNGGSFRGSCGPIFAASS